MGLIRDLPLIAFFCKHRKKWRVISEQNWDIQSTITNKEKTHSGLIITIDNLTSLLNHIANGGDISDSGYWDSSQTADSRDIGIDQTLGTETICARPLADIGKAASDYEADSRYEQIR